jgi:predicted Zn-dependent protease
MQTRTGSDHTCPHGLSDCACRRGDAFLAEPTKVYLASRRQFLLSLAAGGLTAAALPLLEGEARANVFMPSVSEQKKAGQQAAQQVLKQYHEVHDSRSHTLEEVGGRLVDALNAHDRNTWDYRFHVIQSSEINAFALPGGPIFMFTGLMDRITSDSELAAVTGHEMTHVRLQHWAKAVANQQERNLGLGVLLGITHASSGLQTLAGLGNELLTLRYSRGEEQQADEGGLQDMVAAGYNPDGMLALFHMLQTSEHGGEPPQFLSDHPLTSERIRHAQDLIRSRYSRYTNRPM